MGDPRFKALLDEMWELHCEKAEGYGSDEDPLANLRDASEWGLQDFMGAFLRAGDKFQRLKNHVKKGTIPGDSLHNDARDGAAYLLLGLILWEEAQEQINQPSLEQLKEDVQRTLRGEVYFEPGEEVDPEQAPVAAEAVITDPVLDCHVYDHVKREFCSFPSHHEGLHSWQMAPSPTT